MVGTDKLYQRDYYRNNERYRQYKKLNYYSKRYNNIDGINEVIGGDLPFEIKITEIKNILNRQKDHINLEKLYLKSKRKLDKLYNEQKDILEKLNQQKN